MKKANPSEIKHYLKDKYGYYHIPEFERPGNSEFYKILTMNNKVVPHASTRLMCNDIDNEGTHEVINSARSLNGLKNKGIRFADTISNSDIIDLEDIINQTPDFSM